MKTREEKYMLMALKEAKKAELIDEVPIGCIIVKNGKILAKSHNLREKSHQINGHAEMIALTKANKKLQDWQLVDCDMYVTLEPCLMCAGAIIQSHIKNLYFGAFDHKGGAFGSSINANEIPNLNHKVNVKGGILEEECSKIIKNYFKNKREEKKNLD